VPWTAEEEVGEVNVVVVATGLVATGAAVDTPLVSSAPPVATAITRAPDESRVENLFLFMM
jgi:hypothetical protein